MKKGSRRRWFAILLGAVSILAVGISVVTVLRYPGYVEARLRVQLDRLGLSRGTTIVESTCLGWPSPRIRTTAILWSRLFGEDPFAGVRPGGPIPGYGHGVHFNFHKVLDCGAGRLLSAYWSIRENRWHVGGMVVDARWNEWWQCLPGSCAVIGHVEKPAGFAEGWRCPGEDADVGDRVRFADARRRLFDPLPVHAPTAR